LSVVKFCRDNKIKLIYPSSATVYNKNTSYAHCKAILEEIQMAYGGEILGLRIFAGYGVGEEHKGEYASVVHKFIDVMKHGLPPVVYGDGNQTRDFVYIDDIVDNIVDNLDKRGIMDVGTGISTSFNDLIKLINTELGMKIKPIYKKAPYAYIENTTCNNPIVWKVSLKSGIKRMCYEET